MAIATLTGGGWLVPDPAAINVVPGGGLTGEVLTKSSPVDADVAWAAAGVALIADGTIGSIKLAPLATKNYLGRTTAGTGPVEAVPAATLLTDINGQALLVSTVNIKTVNGSSLLGAGDLLIAGGSGGGDALIANPLSQFAATTSLQLKGVISDETGTGSLVFATSPNLITPALGTPSSGTMSNVTGLPITTGVSGLGTNVATFLGTPSSANLALALTDDTGTGANVFGTSPTIATPTISSPTFSGAVAGTFTLPTTATVVSAPTQGDNSLKPAPTSYVDLGLAGKVDLLSQVTLGAGTTAIARAGHANRPVIVNQAGATTGTFAATATSGALAGDSFYLRNTGTGTFTAGGTITAPTGFKLTCPANEFFSADYDSVDDAWYSTTPTASGGGGTGTSTGLAYALAYVTQ